MNLFAWAGAVLVALLALLFVVGTLLARRQEPVERAAAPSDPETRFLQTRSGRVHMLDLGEGDVILLTHGTGRSVADWQEGFAQRLARSHRVVGFDYYGLGLSDRDHGLGTGFPLWARQAIDVLDALEIERVSVVGHSIGGTVAACLAADNPERVERVVLIGNGMAMDPMQWIPFVPGLGELSMGRTRIFSTIFSPQHERRLAEAYAIRGTRAALLTYIRRTYTWDGIRLLTGTYEDIQVPVLQAHGTLDESISIEAARRLSPRIRDTRFIAFEGASHDVHIDASEALAASIESFIAETSR
jgi:2-hydroxymuconate-semialdehyde hydrolase